MIGNTAADGGGTWWMSGIVHAVGNVFFGSHDQPPFCFPNAGATASTSGLIYSMDWEVGGSRSLLDTFMICCVVNNTGAELANSAL